MHYNHWVILGGEKVAILLKSVLYVTSVRLSRSYILYSTGVLHFSLLTLYIDCNSFKISVFLISICRSSREFQFQCMAQICLFPQVYYHRNLPRINPFNFDRNALMQNVNKAVHGHDSDSA